MRSPITRVAAVIALACIPIGALRLFHDSAAPAFGNVIANVVRAESVSFTSRQKLGNQPAFVAKVYVTGDTMRMDMVGVEGPQEGAEKLQSEMQRLNLRALLSVIGDLSRKEAVQLDHFRKTYTKTTVDDRVAGELAAANVIARFRTLKEENAEWVGEEVQDARQLDVYLVKSVRLMGIQAELSGREGDCMKVWVDRETGLPVTILLEVPTDREGKSRDWFEFSSFTWNEPFDQGLFSLDIPEGYTPAAPAAPN